MKAMDLRCVPRLGWAVAVLIQLVLLAGNAGAQPADGTVRGEVRSEPGGEPLVGATVEVLGGAREQAVATDGSGTYELRRVQAGRRVIRARLLGYAPLEIEVMVPAGQEVRVDLSLRVAPVALDPVTVEGGRQSRQTDTVTAPVGEIGLVGARALESTPGMAELGLTDPGRQPGQEPPDPSDVLYVRGAATDLKMVYLDGAQVYAPFPLGGVVEAFTPDLLRSAHVYLGGAPARYDGGLSYVMDLRTRGVNTDAVHSSGAVDLLSARALVEVPFSARGGVLASGRSVHGWGSIDPLPYAYREMLLRGDLALANGAKLRFTGFGNAEEVWLEENVTAPDSAIRWGNTAASVRYTGPVLGAEGEITASLGDFAARLPLRRSVASIAEGSTRRSRLAADLWQGRENLLVRYGASIDRLAQEYGVQMQNGAAVQAEAVGDAFGAYADVGWQLGTRVRLRGGLRADHFSFGAETVLAPRAAATLLITEKAALTLAAGRYHQYLRASEDELFFATSRALEQGAVTPLSVGAASHVTLSLDQDMGEDLRLGVEGYFKSFEGLPSAEAAANASGVDLWLRRDRGALTGWVSYSLAWVWSVGSDSISDRFAGRHLVAAGLGFPLTDRGRFDARFAYGSGLPYSAIPLNASFAQDTPGLAGAERSSPEQLSGGADSPPVVPAPDRAYVRLDLSASHAWDRRVLGTDVRIASYLKLLNTLGNRDALFYHYDRDRNEGLRGIAVFPLVPVVGVEWRF